MDEESQYVNSAVRYVVSKTHRGDAYRKLLEQTTEEILDAGLRAEMKKYSDFIVEKFTLIKQPGGNIGDKEKGQCYTDSRKVTGFRKEAAE